ncbi:MAG: hypothetical protein WBP81_37500, partial [Solirubrobacteraceae bacterium]
ERLAREHRSDLHHAGAVLREHAGTALRMIASVVPAIIREKYSTNRAKYGSPLHHVMVTTRSR